MKNKGNTILIVIIVLALIVGGFFLLRGNEDGALMMEKEDGVMMEEKAMMDGKEMPRGTMMEDGTMMDGEEMMMQKEDSHHVEKGTYEAYATQKLALAKEGHVVLFFHASWCPTCRAADKDINANLTSIPNGVHILKTDYDSNTVLKQKYGVTYQHTFVEVDASGKLIKKWSGSSTLAEIVKNIE